MAEQYRTETDCTELMGELTGSVETLSDNLDTLSGTVSDLSDHVDDVESTCEESTQTLSTEMTRLFNEIQSLISIGSGIPEIEEEIEVSGMTQYPTDKTLSIVDMAADAKSVGDELANLSADMAGALSRIGAVESETGADIPINGEAGASSIYQIIIALNGAGIPITGATGATSIANAVKAIEDGLEEGLTEMTSAEIDTIIEEVFGGED